MVVVVVVAAAVVITVVIVVHTVAAPQHRRAQHVPERLEAPPFARYAGIGH